MNTARMKNPAMLLPEATKAIHALVAAMKTDAIPARTLELVHLRVSQINGCAACLEMHARTLKRGGESDERLFTVAAWRETPFFTDAERAALALAEAATRLADKGGPGARRRVGRGRPSLRGAGARRARPPDRRDQHVQPIQRDDPPDGGLVALGAWCRLTPATESVERVETRKS